MKNWKIWRYDHYENHWKNLVLRLNLRLLISLRHFDEGLTLKTSVFLPFTVANLRFQLSC